ncbi:MAG: hypothetical protein KDK39_04200 [Leptospiraceae bacterium]|nr:hypothetical protein [Leptospiraceae bacterium]
MHGRKANITRILSVAARLYLIPATLVFVFAIILLALGIKALIHAEQPAAALQQTIAGAMLLLISLVFASVWYIQKTRFILFYFGISGTLVSISYMVAAFLSLQQLNHPAIEFVILFGIACFGLYYLLLALNPQVRAFVRERHMNIQ